MRTATPGTLEVVNPRDRTSSAAIGARQLGAWAAALVLIGSPCGPALGQTSAGPGGQQASCLWNSGPYDHRTAQFSTADPFYFGEQQTADDIYIPPACIAHITGVSATLVGDSALPKARLRIYEDCDGRPGRQLFTMDSSLLTDTGQLLAGTKVYTARFNPIDLWLDGGRVYWVSIMGIAVQPTDAWFWATAGGGVVAGTPGMYRAVSNGVPQWTGVQDLGCGCTDFALSVEGECCTVLWDNGPAASSGPSAGGSLSISDQTSIGARTADDFQVPTCDDETVCFVRAVMYSNCQPFNGHFELYTGACSTPDLVPLRSTPFSRIVDLGYSLTIGGEAVRAYEVVAFDPGWILAAGQRYWLSAVGHGGGTIHQRSYFAFASPCDRCAIRMDQGQAIGLAVGLSQWKPVTQTLGTARDFSFLIAVRLPAPPGSATPSCAADFDRNGRIDASDVLDFLNAWFAGCP